MGSECSSTISSEDESSSGAVDPGSSSAQTVIAAPAPVTNRMRDAPQPDTKQAGAGGQGGAAQLSPTTKTRLASLFNRIPKLGRKPEGGRKEEVTVRPPPPSPRRQPARPPSSAGGPELTRTTSDSSGFSRTGEGRGSYRAPRAPSRYLQAAEAYASRGKSGSVAGNPAASTWSASTAGRARSRPGLSSDLFQPPVKHSRTASASPGLRRRRSGSVSREPPAAPAVTSTHSTPSRKPGPRRQHSRDALASDWDKDEMILKRMEEILFTYKSKVEDKLAAEGKELPKDIFEDFTSHWVNSSPHRAKSVDSLDSSEKSFDKNSKPRVTPTQRKEHREGQRTSRIPAPTFYKSPIPSETNL